MKRWAACYIVLNADEYLWQSMSSMVDFSDRIIIVHGSTKYTSPGQVNSFGLSTDKTHEMVMDFQNQHPGKVKYIVAGKVENKADLRNMYIQCMPDINPYRMSDWYSRPEVDWVFVVDHDEVYKSEDLRALDDFVTKNSEISYVYNPQYWFWLDFNHYCEVNEDMVMSMIKEGKLPFKTFKDREGNLIRQGQYHERIFRWDLGLYYNTHGTISDFRNFDLYAHGEFEWTRAVFPCTRYHYGYISKHATERFRYYSVRDYNKTTPEEIEKSVQEDPYLIYLKGGQETLHKVRPFFTVKKFEGTHPPQMNDHPYRNKTVRDLITL